MIITLQDLPYVLEESYNVPGCIIDTNVAFASSYELDPFNEWVEKFFELYREPIYTNLNVRSEFVDLNRRVLLSECLLDFYHDFRSSLPGSFSLKLKSLQTRFDRANQQNQVFKLSDRDLKEFKKLFLLLNSNGKNSWNKFCEDYFYPKIIPVWDEMVNLLKINFLGSKQILSNEFFKTHPKWNSMLEIVGKYGIGSSDAMILNLFIESKFNLFITTDRDLAEAAESMILSEKSNRYVLVP